MMFSRFQQVRRLATTTNLKSRKVIGVRREDKNHWERRTPLAPTHVRSLVDDGVPVLVQSSSRRIFSDNEFERAGAKIVDDVSPADVIVGVKEVPIPHLLRDKTYLMFSHTHKGQSYNMPMLHAVLDRNIRLIDYELLKDENHQRLVRFGTFAGYAGFIDFLHGLGKRLLMLGYSTPFLNVGMTYSYRNLLGAKLAVEAVGMDIARWGLPNKYGPVVFVFTGDGYVSRGAQEIFEQLPHQWVQPKDLKALTESKDFNPNVVYGCVVRERDYLEPVSGQGTFDRADYFANPQKYRSIFHTKIAPYMSILINGIYWESQYPRLLTRQQTRELMAQPNPRFLGVADISCDVEGSLEFMSKVTTIDDPFFIYDAHQNQIHASMKSDGLLVMSIDNLPAEMARESSMFFGSALVDFVRELATASSDADLSPSLRGAIIAQYGKLLPQHQNERLLTSLAKHGQYRVVSNEPRRVLLLGSGMVAQPVVDYLCSMPNTHMTIASLEMHQAAELGRKHSKVAKATAINVAQDAQALGKLVSQHDLVISYVPAPMHPRVAEACIEHRKNMVTASYISPAMAALDVRAKQAGITILNEIGLDPGIDHLSAVKTIDDVHQRGGQIKGFWSVCGGLPAPEASNNALGYKFSWSPRGVLSAGLNESQFLAKGQVQKTERGQLFRHAQPTTLGFAGFSLEYLPNRNSLQYKDLYGIPEAQDIFRGTLRYQGFSNTMQALMSLGYLSEAPHPALQQSQGHGRLTWQQLSENIVGSSASKAKDVMPKNVFEAICSLGIFSEAEPVDIPASGAPIDALCSLLQKKLVFGQDERDMVIMQHRFDIEWSKEQKETRYATLIEYGTVGGYTAMAKTVGMPTAIAADLILTGTAKGRGVIAPLTKDLYEPILQQLEDKAKIVFKEHSIWN